ncbi:MAG: 1-deoxy-D-xylulose-5-phosphate synthase [Firmicutes bacterium]|nr:1-deoxy-D-xylulose-5-phosphate synthase [Bacillota bacterium]
MFKNLLEIINHPQDLHRLNNQELVALAAEIREKIIETVTVTGGHLGASLGVVELTLALHSVLDSPNDKIVWDVGHQCYAHKLITGRRDCFATLRQWEGLSGFPKMDESEHDSFDVGHCSTSISVATGMAIARDLKGEKHKIVAVIGDGSLTGGMAFEALNHAGHLKKDLVVILNDNEMSIAKNVGALSEYLTRLRFHQTLSWARDEIENFISRIPAIGSSMSKAAALFKDALKSVLPGQIFEELGFSYLGPVDGHNIGQLKSAIQDGIARGGPILIHVLTQKGKGYAPAMENPEKFHGVAPQSAPKNDRDSVFSYSEVLGKSLVSLAKEDERIVAITAAMASGTGLEEYAKKFSDRFFDVGIAEQHALTLAAGMATQGLKPVVAIYSSFLQRAYDQILHDVCLPDLPVVIAIDRAGVVGEDGPTHHGIFDISYLRHMPNIIILAPKDGVELYHMLKWAVTSPHPVAIRYPRATTTLKSQELDRDFTKSEVVYDQGDHFAILAVGNMVAPALEAAQVGGFKCKVVNARTIKPLDYATIDSVLKNTRNLVTIEDNVVAGGFGSAVLEYLAKERHNVERVLTLGYPMESIPQGTIAQIHQHYGLNVDGIINSIKEFMVLKVR